MIENVSQYVVDGEKVFIYSYIHFCTEYGHCPRIEKSGFLKKPNLLGLIAFWRVLLYSSFWVFRKGPT